MIILSLKKTDQIIFFFFNFILKWNFEFQDEILDFNFVFSKKFDFFNIEINKKQNIDASVLNGLLEKCNSKEHADVELAVYNSLKKLVQA